MNRPCPVCAEATRELFLTKESLQLVRCPRCSMIYVDQVPEQFVSGDYYDREAGSYYLSGPKLESDYSPVRFERELRIFRRYCTSGRVLDVGCSSGAFLFQLNQRWPGRYKILGTDVSGAPLDYAESRGVPVRRGNFLEEDSGQGEWDAITFWAVLEHVADPAAFLQRAARLLKPNGRCFVLVPNLRSLAVRVLRTRYRYICAQHLNYFSARTLLRMVQKRFEVLEMRSTHFNPMVILQDWRHQGGEVSNQARGELLRRTTAFKQSPWLKPARLAYRVIERMLGELGLADNLVVVLKPASNTPSALANRSL